MPVLIKGAGGGGMRVNGVKVRALAGGTVTKGSFLDYVPRTFNPENATPSYVDQAIYLDANHYLVVMRPTSNDVWLYVREVNQVTGASAVVYSKQIGNYGVGVWRMSGNQLIVVRTTTATYADLYTYANGALTFVSTITLSSTRQYLYQQFSDEALIFYYFVDVYKKSMAYKVVTLSGGIMTQTAEKTATISHTTRSRAADMRIDFFENPRAMVIHWSLRYYDKDDERVASMDESGVVSYVFDANWDMTKITESRLSGTNSILSLPDYRFRKCIFRRSGTTTIVNGGAVYQKVYTSVLNSDGSVSENVAPQDNVFLPNGIGTQTEDGDDLYFLQGYQRGFAVCKCTWSGSAFVFQWIKKDKDTYERYKAYENGSYGPDAIKPVSGFIIVNGNRRIAFEFRLRVPVTGNSYSPYDKYGTMPIETAFHVRDASYSEQPTVTNGVMRMAMIALENASAGAEFDALIYDARDAVEYTQ